MSLKENLSKTYSAISSISTGRLFLFNDTPLRNTTRDGKPLELEKQKFLTLMDKIFISIWLPLFHLKALINKPENASKAIRWFFGTDAEKAFELHVSAKNYICSTS